MDLGYSEYSDFFVSGRSTLCRRNTGIFFITQQSLVILDCVLEKLSHIVIIFEKLRWFSQSRRFQIPQA